MAVILHDQVVDDDYSAEIIAKIRELSPDLDTWVVTEQYLVDTSEDNLSPEWLRNRLVVKLVDELTSMGVIVNYNPDDICDSPLHIKTILNLRSKFDADKFYEVLKSHVPVKDFVSELLSDPDCITDIIDYCSSAMPVDEGWEQLKNFNADNPGVISSNIDFAETLGEIIDKVEELGTPDITSDVPIESVESYVKFLGDRKTKIENIAETIYSSRVSTEGNELVVSDSKQRAVAATMSDFEKELGRASVIKQLSPGVDMLDIARETREKYLPKWNHTLDYWCQPEHLEEIPSPLIVSIMVATMYVDLGGDASARVKVIDKFESVADVIGNRYDAFREMIDNALANLVSAQEGVD